MRRKALVLVVVVPFLFSSSRAMALPKMPAFVKPLLCSLLVIGGIGVTVQVLWSELGNRAERAGQQRDPNEVCQMAANGAPNHLVVGDDVYFLQNGFLLKLTASDGTVKRVPGQELSHKRLERSGNRLLLSDDTRDDEYDPATGKWKNLRTVHIPDNTP